jgi:hypothetical protein
MELADTYRAIATVRRAERIADSIRGLVES